MSKIVKVVSAFIIGLCAVSILYLAASFDQQGFNPYKWYWPARNLVAVFGGLIMLITLGIIGAIIAEE